jgi:hypothetical protein
MKNEPDEEEAEWLRVSGIDQSDTCDVSWSGDYDDDVYVSGSKKLCTCRPKNSATTRQKQNGCADHTNRADRHVRCRRTHKRVLTTKRQPKLTIHEIYTGIDRFGAVEGRKPFGRNESGSSNNPVWLARLQRINKFGL